MELRKNIHYSSRHSEENGKIENRLRIFPFNPKSRYSLLDIGSGGGFPGIPLKILIPSLSVTLIDSSRKKTNFQKHVIRTLDLKNTDAAHVRAEAFANAFDVVISRALSSLDTFVSMALVAKNGIIIAMKGKISEEEIELVRSLVSKTSKTAEALSKGNFS